MNSKYKTVKYKKNKPSNIEDLVSSYKHSSELFSIAANTEKKISFDKFSSKNIVNIKPSKQCTLVLNNIVNNSEILNSLGNIYEKKRDFKNSEKFYLKSIQENKNNEIALSNLAILYHNLGREKDAKKFYNKVLSINSNNIGALYNLSKIDKSIINIVLNQFWVFHFFCVYY